ncbi:hypothetical protein AB0H83_29130 [Dactylosporangium sp. NPDC050688]|uniref:hypothetical protein n=1 Tax=Dactylosporangium sp. NPDC050688 TaxID=3157217 RepID=UPI0033C01F91
MIGLANRQGEHGMLSAATATIQHAVDIYRRLAATHPRAYLPALALALNNVADRMHATGDVGGPRPRWRNPLPCTVSCPPSTPDDTGASWPPHSTTGRCWLADNNRHADAAGVLRDAATRLDATDSPPAAVGQDEPAQRVRVADRPGGPRNRRHAPMLTSAGIGPPRPTFRRSVTSTHRSHCRRRHGSVEMLTGACAGRLEHVRCPPADEPRITGGLMPKLLSSGKTWTAFLIWLLAGVGLGLVTILLYAAGHADHGAVMAIGVAVTAAAMLTGGVTGFIFGVPKMLGHAAAEQRTAANEPLPDVPPGGSRPQSWIIGNTNLEQISDWLTKILVGVGLTQFAAIASFGGRVVDSVAPALGGGPAAKVFAGALLVYAIGFGFVTGWLYTRLLLGGAMAAADRRAMARTLITAAQSAQQAGDNVTARHLREQAMDLLDQEASPAAVGDTPPGGAAVTEPRG